MSGGSLTTRARILERLRTGPAASDEIAAEHGLTLRTVSAELKLMRLEGVVELCGDFTPGVCCKHALTERLAQRQKRAADPRFGQWEAAS